MKTSRNYAAMACVVLHGIHHLGAERYMEESSVPGRRQL